MHLKKHRLSHKSTLDYSSLFQPTRFFVLANNKCIYIGTCRQKSRSRSSIKCIRVACTFDLKQYGEFSE